MPEVNEPPIKIFLSYAHADDLVLDFIEPFTKSLKHMAFSDQGRTLEIFVDRDAIGWGKDWQEGIRQAIESTVIFMPIVTRQYFDRPPCREELLTFYNTADRLGVTSLLLPVVILGHSYISLESTDVASRIIAEGQYKDLKTTWIDGPESATWRRTIVNLAAELTEAVTVAEQNLVTPASHSNASEDNESSDRDDNAPGAAEVSEALEFFQDETNRVMPTMKNAIDRFSSILTRSTPTLAKASPADSRRILLEVAAELLPVGSSFRDQARGFETMVLHTDQVMRSYVAYLKENDLKERLEEERKAIGPVDETLAPLTSAEEAMNGFLLQMKPLEAMSAPLRKSLREFREGAKAINSAITIMKGWGTITD
jgi:hypothetical protein